MRYELIDSSPYSKSSHSLEYRDGFKTASKVTVEEDKGEWWVYGVYTNDDYRGQGLAKSLIEYVQNEYGPIKIQSEADEFWMHLGFSPDELGWWRESESRG